MPVWDVIVVGAGPAGCAAAIICTQVGLRVVVISETEEPSLADPLIVSPIESIHPGVTSLLRMMDAKGVEDKATVAYYRGTYVGDQFTPFGQDENGEWQGMHIRRDLFHQGLRQSAKDAGICFHENEKVESILSKEERCIGVRTSRQNIASSYIIDASGKKGYGGKHLKFKRKFYSPPLVCWTGISECPSSLEFKTGAAYFVPGKSGWTWLAPIMHQVCAWTRLAMKGEKDFSPPAHLHSCKPVGEKVFSNMRWRLFRPVCREGLVLCGDAAGILDPAAGQGIFNALLSGIKAGQTVIACIRDPAMEAVHLALYDDWFIQQFEEKAIQLKMYYRENKIAIL